MICRDGFSSFGDLSGWCGLMGRILRLWLRFGRVRARIGAGERLCRPHRRDQRPDAQDVHDALEIVGQHVQGHLGADLT